MEGYNNHLKTWQEKKFDPLNLSFRFLCWWSWGYWKFNISKQPPFFNFLIGNECILKQSKKHYGIQRGKREGGKKQQQQGDCFIDGPGFRLKWTIRSLGAEKSIMHLLHHLFLSLWLFYVSLIFFFFQSLKSFPPTFRAVFLISDLFATFPVYPSLVKFIWKVFFNHCSQQHY